MTLRKGSPGITALSLFFVFGAVTSGLAAVMLLFPGSVLEPIWRLNPRAHESFAAIGICAVVLMVVVCLTCVAAALGLWRCKRWGLGMAITILSINLIGDLANALIAGDWRTLIGLPIGAVMIAYLLRKQRAFNR
jgi:uncharacterized membrane protein (DUF2068 family)